MFESFDTSSSALRAERVRLTVIANNLANVYTTRDELGRRIPYQRKLVVFVPGNAENANPNLGVTAEEIVEDDAAPRLVWDPTHPDRIRVEDLYLRDKDGNLTDTKRPDLAKLSESEFEKLKTAEYVAMPNVDPVKEMNDALMAARSYEANVAAIEVSKSLLNESLSIIA